MTYKTLVVDGKEVAYECDICGNPIEPGQECIRSVRGKVIKKGKGRLDVADGLFEDIRHANEEECVKT